MFIGRAVCVYGGWSVHIREPYMHFQQFFTTPLFLHIVLVAVKVVLCGRCSMFSVVSPALIPSILSGSNVLPAVPMSRCHGLLVSLLPITSYPGMCRSPLLPDGVVSLRPRVFYSPFPAHVLRALCELSSAPVLPQILRPSVCHASLNPP